MIRSSTDVRSDETVNKDQRCSPPVNVCDRLQTHLGISNSFNVTVETLANSPRTVKPQNLLELELDATDLLNSTATDASQQPCERRL